jgi:hypothetical protein
MRRTFRRQLLLLICATAIWHVAVAADPPPQTASAQGTLPPYRVEWVYRVKWGEVDEFWRLFRKNQIPLLDREKQLGRVLSHTVYKPGLHTSEDQRWALTVAHYDLPIREVDPHSAEE